MTQSNQRCVAYVSINALVACNAHNTSITFTEFLCERPKCELIEPRADVASKVRRNMRYRSIATLCLFGIASLVALKYPFLGLGICSCCLIGYLRPAAPGTEQRRAT
jgi:hypothetical protein